tara:strand:+ start:931 stop:3177 length:2247 start_codon:yes stop_codon:yes gene_type:complete
MSSTETIQQPTASVNTIGIKEFYDMHKIPYCYATHIIKNGKKTLKYPLRVGWEKLSYATLMELNDIDGRRGDESTIVAYLGNSPFMVIDADTDEGMKYMGDHYGSDNCSHSISRNMPHMYMKKDTVDPAINATGWKPGLDLVYKVIFEAIGGEMDGYNPEGMLMFGDFPPAKSNTISRNLAVELGDTDRTFDVKILDIIDRKYFGENYYTDWIKICWAIKYAWGDEAEDIAIKYSLHDDYSVQETEKAVQDIFNRYNNKKKITFGTLCYYAKESNETEFVKWQQSNLQKCTTIRDLAKQRLKDEFFNLLISCEGVVFYREKDTYEWIYDKDVIRKGLYRYIAYHDERFFIGEHKITKTIDEWIEKKVVSRKNTYDLVDDLMELCPKDDEFKKNLKQVNKDRIWFKNGYYSFKSNTFIVPPTNEIMNSTMVRIDREYRADKIDYRATKEIYDRILLPIFSNRRDLIDNFLYELRKVFNGSHQNKKWFALVGERECGKGVVCDLVKNSFSNYAGMCDYSKFVTKKNDKNSTDFNWLLQKQYIRFLYIQEADHTKLWDGTQIKSICSGGDVLTTRALFSTHDTQIEPELSMFVFCNDYLTVEPSDANQKLIAYDLKSVFIDAGDDKPLSNVLYCVKDKTLRSGFCTEERFLNTFCRLIFNATPAEYPECEKVQNDETIDVKEVIKKSFQYDPIGVLSPTCLKEFIKEKSLTLTNSKLRNILKGVFPLINLEKRRTSYFVKGLILLEDDDMV